MTPDSALKGPEGAALLGGLDDPGAAVTLDSASLHLAHGLRPIKKVKSKFAYVQAQHKFAFTLFCTAHCQRVNFS